MLICKALPPFSIYPRRYALNFSRCSSSRKMLGLNVIVWLAPFGRTLQYSPSLVFPPSAVPTEFATDVGPFVSTPLVGQIALDKNVPALRPLGVATVNPASSPAQ